MPNRKTQGMRFVRQEAALGKKAAGRQGEQPCRMRSKGDETVKFTITGSGGCVSLPKPTCQCPVCRQAREKGHPYARHGCSLYLHDAALLIDTPEDIGQALNAAGIEAVDAIAYSHWDPDHTMGMRVMEQLRMDWLALSVDDFHPTPIRVLALDGVMRDINAIASRFGPYLSYYESQGLIRRETVEAPVALGDITLTFVPVDDTHRVTVFLFEQGGRRLVYAPCDVKPFPRRTLFEGAELLVIGNTMVGPTLKNGFALAEDNPLRKELFVMEEIMELKASLGIDQVIITHLEEDWGKSYDDYLALQAQYPGVRFAHDGLCIAL